MTRQIPLFPLPGVVLLPGTLLPLHIFEPRYREMVAHALAGDRTIGMALLKADLEIDGGRSPIHAIGGAGEIVDSERLDDGRYNILLEGRFRYRVVSETPGTPFRIAEVEEVPSSPFLDPREEERICGIASGLFGAIAPEIALSPLPEEQMSAERLASEIAIRLRYAPQELQGFLELDAVPTRFGFLVARMAEWEKRLAFLRPFRPPELDVTRN
ncbi:MAG: LON peptidase substrate-binding domain-containing protein [Acidobacteriota bacterium]